MKKSVLTNTSKIGLGLSIGLVVIAPKEALALASVEFAIRELCQHMEGNLGGLLMVTAGVGGMISAAFGNMKALYSCIITGIGAFTVSSMLSLYFPKAYSICAGEGGNTARVKSESVEGTNVSRINEITALNNYLGKDSGGSEVSGDSPIQLEEDDSESELF